MVAKRFTETVQLQPQNMDTGAARGIQSLAHRLDQFASAIKSESVRAGKRIGAREGQEVEFGTQTVDGHEVAVAPERRKASLLDIITTAGERTSAYNKVVGTAYIAALGNDNRQALASIEIDNPNDMVAYNTKVDGYKTGVMEGVDPALRGAVLDQLDTLHTSGQIRVNQRAVTRQIEIADVKRTEAIAGSSSAAIRLARTGDEVGAAQALLETKVLLNSFVGQPGYDQASADFAYKQVQKTVAAEHMFSGVIRQAESPGGIPKAVGMIRKFRDANITNFTVEEQDAMFKTLVSDLNMVISLQHKEEDDEARTVTAIQKEKSGELFLGITIGSMSTSDVVVALASKQISGTQANMLLQVVSNRGSGVDDFTLINEIETRIANNEDADSIAQDITSNTGSRLTESTGRDLINDLRESKDKASPLTTSESKAAFSFIEKMTIKLGIMGAIDFDSQKRLAGLQREYREAVLAGENPWAVADKLVNASNELEDTIFIYGTSSDTQDALEQLNTAAKSGSIGKVAYDREFAIIARAMKLQTTLTAFTKAQKAARERVEDGE